MIHDDAAIEGGRVSDASHDEQGVGDLEEPDGRANAIGHEVGDAEEEEGAVVGSRRCEPFWLPSESLLVLIVPKMFAFMGLKRFWRDGVSFLKL